jgi:hypothetical protein
MALKEDLEVAVKKIFHDSWDSRVGRIVPVPEDLGLGNDAVKLDATVLYADIADSTKLVDASDPHFAAEVYRTYLTCAARIVKAIDGIITAYDGDRIMGVFIGDQKNSNAVKAAMQINSSVLNIINPALSQQYPSATYRLRHVIGIDTSPLFVARIGVRNDNDLVSAGRQITRQNWQALMKTIRFSSRQRFITNFQITGSLVGRTTHRCGDLASGPRWVTSLFTVLTGHGKSE